MRSENAKRVELLKGIPGIDLRIRDLK